jgi:hypothetical protein
LLNNGIYEQYFNWLCDVVNVSTVSYNKLLRLLHRTKFRWSNIRDKNRAEDGVDLRFRFRKSIDCLSRNEVLNWHDEEPCSVLEMMIALAIRAEEQIMDNPQVGNRTTQWFWGMVASLGLTGMSDDMFDLIEAKDIIERFLDREYSPDGKGGLFTIRDCEYDLRDVEIWTQLCWYLDRFV